MLGFAANGQRDFSGTTFQRLHRVYSGASFLSLPTGSFWVVDACAIQSLIRLFMGVVPTPLNLERQRSCSQNS